VTRERDRSCIFLFPSYFPLFDANYFGQKRETKPLVYFLFWYDTKGLLSSIFTKANATTRLRVERREDERRGRALRIFLHDLTIPTMSKDEVFWRFHFTFFFFLFQFVNVIVD
jgi:hypothetical protein